MKKILYCLVALLIMGMTACSTFTPLTEEEQAMLIEGHVFTEEDNPTKVEYVPVEVVKYVFPEEGKIVETQSQADSEEIVSDAIENSVVTADANTEFLNSITEYNFQDGKIYEIFTSPKHVTDVRLAPGETISGDAAIGDSESWQMTTAVSSENGRSVTHIYIKPVTSGLETTMIIPTDQRTYYIRLRSFDSLHMLGVRWLYPGIATFGNPDGQVDPGIDLDVSELNFNYKISGDKPFWRPVAVFDDGTRTYFQFDPRFSNASGAPALYLLPKKSNGASKAEVVNYIVKGNMYIADFVLQDKQAWFLMTDKDQVKIAKD